MRCIFDVRSGILKVESDLWFVGERAFGMRVSFDFLGETSFFRLPFLSRVHWNKVFSI